MRNGFSCLFVFLVGGDAAHGSGSTALGDPQALKNNDKNTNL